jgi:hypothetical protein
MSRLESVTETLKPGELYAGLILGKGGTPDHHVVLLPGDAQDVSWAAAREWAALAGGELPNRRELSLLIANQKDQFHRVWYWSSEPSETRSQLVWGQNFYSGIQTMYGRQCAGGAAHPRRVTPGESCATDLPLPELNRGVKRVPISCAHDSMCPTEQSRLANSAIVQLQIRHFVIHCCRGKK